MSAWLAPPATRPPTPWATWTDALLADQLRLLVRHDRFPMPGAAPVNVDHEVTPTLVALLARSRAQG